MFIKKFTPLFDTDESGQLAEPTPEPVVESDDAQPQAEKIRINYLGEEKEIDLEEAKTLAQKGMNYEPLQEKWEKSKGTISKIEEIARKAGFVNDDGHGDIEAYYEAANEQLRETEIAQMTSEYELPQELAEELYLSRKERAERQAEREKQAMESKKQADYMDLLNFYKEVHGKDFDAETKLPNEVWEAVEKGVPPKYAYAEYLTKQSFKEKAIEQANAENSGASPGGVTGKASTPERDFFTSEELDKLTSKDLDNPNIFEKAMRSLSKLK